MHREQIAKELLRKILGGYVALADCQRWLENEKGSYEACGLQKGDLSQSHFVSYFLFFLRDKGRLIQNLYRNPTVRNPDLTDTQLSDNEYLSHEFDKESRVPSTFHKNDYTSNFPGIKESSCRAVKSKRRIKPTPISDQEDAENSAFKSRSKYPVSQGKAEMFSKRFSSKKDYNSSRYQVTDINCTRITSQNNETSPSLESLVILDKVIKLYVFILIQNTMVPNITAELRFVLNMLDNICDSVSSCLTKTEISEEDQIDILSSIKEWNYFCLGVVTSLEPLLLKMEFIIRKFIYTKLLKFSPTIEDKILQKKVEMFASKLLENTNVPCSIYNVVHEENKFKFNLFNENNSFCEGQSRFLQELKNWNQYTSDEEIFSKLDFINKFDGSVTSLYNFGQLFVECLITSLLGEENCKADNDKKLAQLTSRLIKPLLSDPVNEPSFNRNELFFKIIIEYCTLHHPKHLHYIKYWLCFKIHELSKKPQTEIGDSLPRDIKNSILVDLKLKISLAKCLGYIEFLNRKSNWELSKNEKDIFIKVYAEVLPYIDIKHILIKSIELGMLTVTIPWIVQYLCMADNCTPYIPYYYDTISILVAFYLCNTQRTFKDEAGKYYVSCEPKKELSLMLSSRHSNKLEDTTYTERKTFYIKETPCVFLKLWIGKLFEHKVFGESIFYELFEKYISNWTFFKKGSVSPRNCIDCTDLIDNEAFYVLCAHFSRLKYWENSNSFSRNIRPLLLEPENEEKASNIAEQIEEQFLNDNQNIHTLMNFIIGRISSIFENKLSQIMEEVPLSITNCSSLLSDTASSSLLKERIANLALECNEKATTSMKTLIPTDLPESVVNASYLICSRKLNDALNNFLISKGLECFVLKNISIVEYVTSESQSIEKSCESASFDLDAENVLGKDNGKSNQGPLSRMFSRVNTLTRQLISIEDTSSENVSETLNKLLEISNLLDTSYDKQLWEDLYNIAWNYTLQLIIIKPDLATEIFLDNISSFWEKFHFGNNETRILCPRVISPSALQEKIKQKRISKKIAQLVNFVLEKQLLTPELLVAQCVSLLQYTWTKRELEFIETIISNILDSTLDLSVSERLSIDAVADQANAMKCLEPM